MCSVLYLYGASCMYSRTAPVPHTCMCHVAGQQPMQGQYLTGGLPADTRPTPHAVLAACGDTSAVGGPSAATIPHRHAVLAACGTPSAAGVPPQLQFPTHMWYWPHMVILSRGWPSRSLQPTTNPKFGTDHGWLSRHNSKRPTHSPVWLQ